MTNRVLPLILLALWLLAGCTHQPPAADPKAVPNAGVGAADAAEWNDRNAEIYRFLLAELEAPDPGRIYFITTTPMAAWGKTGDWSTIPAAELQVHPHAAKHRPAHEAHLRGGAVLEKGTDAEAWMRWISVKRWISETEVEVEAGVWCCPLGGGASTTIYEKVDGKWQFKERVDGWVS